MTDMWMVRAGPDSFLINEFLKNNVVAIGWNIGDLTDKSPDEIKKLIKQKYHDKNKVSSAYSQVIRFIQNINIGDSVVSYDNSTKTYFLGKITSKYYRSEMINKVDESNDNYFDVRDVEWIGEVQKNQLKKSTQSTLGTSITVFNLNEDVQNDILNKCNGRISNPEDCSVNIIRKYLSETDLKLEISEHDKLLFTNFKKLYSPEVLKSLDGIDVLETIFPQKGNKSNLCYALEFSDEFKWLCGGIRGGSAFKFSLFKYSETNSWTVGSAKSNLKTLTEVEAIELAIKIRDAIVEGAEYIENNDLESIEDYIQLEMELNRLFSESQKDCTINPTHSWIHKYYSIIYPNKIPIVHADGMKKEMIRKFRIEPENGFYANDGQLYELAKNAGVNLYSLFDERIVRLFFEAKNIWDPIEKGTLVRLKDCDNGPKTSFSSGLKRNMIYFGAPGTGKSYNLNQDKDKLLEKCSDNYERVTFHPDYSYANFVGTYKPVPENNSITYKYVPGPFMRVLKKAMQNPNEPYLLIIEEINRSNVAAVFGEVFQLLDRENYESMYPIDATEDMKSFINEDKIKIPQNMFIWATMNSADQGVFPMDTAFKRRWDFKYFSINNNEKLIENTKVTLNNKEFKWNDLRKQINDELLSYKINEDKLIGPFFAFNEYHNKEIPTETFKDIFKNKIIMYLFEDAAKSKRNELFSGVGKGKNLTYSQICEEFDKNGIEIFTESIREKFITEDDGE